MGYFHIKREMNFGIVLDLWKPCQKIKKSLQAIKRKGEQEKKEKKVEENNRLPSLLIFISSTLVKLSAGMFLQYSQIHVWIYEKGDKENAPYSTKVDDKKLKGMAVLFFSTPLSSFSCSFSMFVSC